MERKETPKQRAKLALKIVRRMPSGLRNAILGKKKGAYSSGETKRLVRTLNSAIRVAFKLASLNINNSDDWRLLALWLAWAIYGRKSGHPKVWTRERLRTLLAGFNQAKSNDPKLTELSYCDQLVEDKTNSYGGLTAQTLRRRLQQAKKLEFRATTRPQSNKTS